MGKSIAWCRGTWATHAEIMTEVQNLSRRLYRCYAPTLEKDVWQCEFKQTVDLSTEPSALPIQSSRTTSDKCLPGYGTLQTNADPALKVYTSCGKDVLDGASCAYNQHAGTCKDGFCVSKSDAGALQMSVPRICSEL